VVKYSQQALDATFAALADPTRRAILARLALGEVSVSELARPFEMSLPAVSKHLSVLEDAGLVSRERQGRVRRCRLTGVPLRAAADWISTYRRFWEERLDALARYLEEQQTTEEASNGKSTERKDRSRRGKRG